MKKATAQPEPESWGFMTARQVADELGINVSLARGLIQARMPHIRVGRNEFRVARKDFDAFVQKSIVPPIYKH